MLNRNYYLNELIKKRNNKLIKVIIGLRRCGKSYLLNNIFLNYLLKEGINKDHIVQFAFDNDEDIDKLDSYFPNEPTKIVQKNKSYLINSKKFRAYIKDITDENGEYVFLLDEIQLLDSFVGTLNGFLSHDNFDVYVTGSNSRMLSKDVATEFRGRGDVINLYPLSFKELYEYLNLGFEETYKLYSTFGGMPYLINLNDENEKIAYLKHLYKEIYLKDLIERNNIVTVDNFEKLVNILSSSIGSSTNTTKLENTFNSELKLSYSHNTIKNHIDYLIDAFLISKVDKYDLRGKAYINSTSKYYFTDIGIRNTIINFRQIEQTHIMENIIYNELIMLGYNVDVGIIDTYEINKNNVKVRKYLETDFVCNKASQRIYIQSCFSMPDNDKYLQETKSLKKINDNFKKIIIVADAICSHYTEDGIYILSLKDFLLNGIE